MAYEDSLLGRRQKRIDRKAARRDKAPAGSLRGRMLQNQINRLSDDPTRHSLLGRSDYMKSKDTSEFDVTNPRDVVKFQRMAGLKTDGIFGPKTESAWREHVNTQRESEDKEGYFWSEVTEDLDTNKNIDNMVNPSPTETAEQAEKRIGYSPYLGPEGYGGDNLVPDYFNQEWKPEEGKK